MELINLWLLSDKVLLKHNILILSYYNNHIFPQEFLNYEIISTELMKHFSVHYKHMRTYLKRKHI